MKVLKVIKSIFAIVGLFAFGVLTGALFFKKPTAKIDDDAEKAKEGKKNEIENTPASVLVAAADNADELCIVKDELKTDFRERIRNRLDAELHRLSSGGTDSDCGAGSGWPS